MMKNKMSWRFIATITEILPQFQTIKGVFCKYFYLNDLNAEVLSDFLERV